jgi:hypothetical protein
MREEVFRAEANISGAFTWLLWILTPGGPSRISSDALLNICPHACAASDVDLLRIKAFITT